MEVYYSHCIQHRTIGIRLSCPILEETNAHCALPVFEKLFHVSMGLHKALFLRQSRFTIPLEELVEGVIVRVKPTGDLVHDGCFFAS